MNRHPCVSKTILLLIAVLFCCFSGIAQTVQSALSGTIEDAGGRAVPNASIEVEQKETGLVRTVASDASGTYRISGLPIGTYSFVVNKPGFAAAYARGVRLYVGQLRNLDVTLQVAGTASNVSVSASGTEIDPVSASVGARVERRQIADLPINGRNWASLLPLIPGATDPGSSDQRTVRFAGHG